MSKVKDMERVEVFFDGSYAVKNNSGTWTVKICTQTGNFAGAVESTSLERVWYLASVISPHLNMVIQEKKKKKPKLKIAR